MSDHFLDTSSIRNKSWKKRPEPSDAGLKNFPWWGSMTSYARFHTERLTTECQSLPSK